MKKKILFVNDEMVVGGVSRVLINLLKQLDYQKYSIDLLVLHKHGEVLKDIPQEVRVLDGSKYFEACDLSLKELIKEKKISLIIKKLKLLFLMKTGLIINYIKKARKSLILEDYTCEIAFKEGFCTVFVSVSDVKTKVNWIHTDYGKFNYAKNHMRLLTKCLKHFDYQISPAQQALDAFLDIFKPSGQAFVINNMIDIERVVKLSQTPFEFKEKGLKIVSVGRLHHQKAYDRLIEAVAEVIKTTTDFVLYIVGDGPLRQELENLIIKLKLEKYVYLIGYDPNPYKYIRNSDLFLLASKYEASPTVVYEALNIKKTPIMACDVAGLDLQLEHGKLGIIVENNKQAIVEALTKVILDPTILKQYQISMQKYRDTNQRSLELIYQIFEK